MNKKRGQATAVVIGVAALVVLVLAGIGFYAYKNPTFTLYGKDDENKPRLSGSAGNGTSTIGVSSTSTPSGTSTIAIVEPDEEDDGGPERTYSAPRAQTQSATVYRAPIGPAYRNPTFGLTVPGSYQTTATQNIYGGVPTTASYNFYTGGVFAFTINVFSKEQWNNIRIQETVNVKEGTGPDYLGEGRYLGENKTWIFAVVYGAYQPSGVSFH